MRFFHKNLYRWLSDEQKADLQLHQCRLCMPLAVFKRALETVLSRTITEGEIFSRRELLKEFYKKHKPQELETILQTIPEQLLT